MSDDRWLYKIQPGEREIDWETQGDPLVEYLRQAMPVHITMSPWIQPDRDPDVDPMLSNGYCLYSDTLSTRLIFVFFVDGIGIFVETDQKPSSEADLQPWMSAFAEAYDRLFEDEPEYAWWAAIGPSPRDYIGCS
jgi:hypothetical protein